MRLPVWPKMTIRLPRPDNAPRRNWRSWLTLFPLLALLAIVLILSILAVKTATYTHAPAAQPTAEAAVGNRFTAAYGHPGAKATQCPASDPSLVTLSRTTIEPAMLKTGDIAIKPDEGTSPVLRIHIPKYNTDKMDTTDAGNPFLTSISTTKLRDLHQAAPPLPPTQQQPTTATTASSAFPASLYDSPGHAIAAGLFVGVAATGIFWVVVFVIRVYVSWIGQAVAGAWRGWGVGVGV